MTAKVYGDRTCRGSCRGICHKESWRRKVGQRKAYYCSESCLRHAMNKNYQKSCKKVGVGYWFEVQYTDEQWIEYRDMFFEPVEVICR